MTILYQRLDSRITQGSSTSVVVPGRTKNYNPAGKLYQNFLGASPKHVYDYSHGLRSRFDFQQVLDAFYVCMFTPYEGLLHRDWRDYVASQSNTNCAVIDSTHVQLQRKHKFGAISWLRNITKPCASPGIALYRTTGVAAPVPIASSVDTTTGTAAITGHTTGDTYAWEGQFDVPVAFADDEWVSDLEVNIENLHLMSHSIKLEEIL